MFGTFSILKSILLVEFSPLVFDLPNTYSVGFLVEHNIEFKFKFKCRIQILSLNLPFEIFFRQQTNPSLNAQIPHLTVESLI